MTGEQLFKAEKGTDKKRRRKKRRFTRVPINILIPNIITLLALCSGLTAIRMAIEGRFELAVAGILVAGILDAADGRVARLLKGATRFGAELDSLVDFVNFGVAPAVMLYVWSLHNMKSIGWIVALSYAVCMSLRLARFNVELDDPDKPAWKGNYFTGVPAPAGAMVLLLPIYLQKIGVDGIAGLTPLIMLYCAFVAFLLVSRIPTFSGKMLGQRVRPDAVLPIMVVVVLFAAVLLSFPWITLTGIGLAYLAFIPVSVLRYRKQERRHAEFGKTGS